MRSPDLWNQKSFYSIFMAFMGFSGCRCSRTFCNVLSERSFSDPHVSSRNIRLEYIRSAEIEIFCGLPEQARVRRFGLSFYLTNAAPCGILYMKAYSISEAARLLGVDRRTVQRWVSDKRIPAPTTQVLAGVRLRFWTEQDMAKLKEYKATRYWGKGESRTRRQKSKQKL
jgi:excisionase family DNA binding protein